MKLGLVLGNEYNARVATTERIKALIKQVRMARDMGFDGVSAGQHYLSWPMQCIQPIPLLARLAADAYLMQIGKQLNHWDAVDIGVFRFQPSVFDAFDLLYERHGSEFELTWVMRHLIAQPHGVTTCDINGLFWSDIDTEEDYYRADELFRIVADRDI